MEKIVFLTQKFKWETKHTLICVGVCFVLLLILTLIFLIKRRKKTKSKNDLKDTANAIISAIGINNFKKIKVSGNRVIVKIEDADFINRNTLKENGLRTVISKKEVKFLIKDNANLLAKEIKQLRKDNSL